MTRSFGTKVCLTPEFVDDLSPPSIGEIWIGDNHLDYFGIRAWAGKKGGSKAFAIRLRDRDGRLVRETFVPHRDSATYVWMKEWERPFGYFLEPARRWAQERIRIHFGFPTSEQMRSAERQLRERRTLSTKIGDAVDQRLAALRSRSKNHVYVDQIQNLIAQYVPNGALNTTFRDVSVHKLADAISQESIRYGNVKILRAFVGGVFKAAAGDSGAIGLKLGAIQQRCAQNLTARKAPRYPEILRISSDNYGRFFSLLEAEPNWRVALAIRLYFATGARLQQVLKARWSDLIDRQWYPFVPSDRKLWYESHQRLDDQALAVIDRIQSHHEAAGLRSPFLFPSLAKGPQFHITSIQRFWSRTCGTMGWHNLPLSHVVLRHRPRDNPSYSLDFYRRYLNFDKARLGKSAVSKVGKRRRDSTINAITYGPSARFRKF